MCKPQRGGTMRGGPRGPTRTASAPRTSGACTPARWQIQVAQRSNAHARARAEEAPPRWRPRSPYVRVRSSAGTSLRPNNSHGPWTSPAGSGHSPGRSATASRSLESRTRELAAVLRGRKGGEVQCLGSPALWREPRAREGLRAEQHGTNDTPGVRPPPRSLDRLNRSGSSGRPALWVGLDEPATATAGYRRQV